MLKHLQVRRPLVLIDVEITGLDTLNGRIIELSCRRLQPDGEVNSLDLRFNPTIPDPPNSDRSSRDTWRTRC